METGIEDSVKNLESKKRRLEQDIKDLEQIKKEALKLTKFWVYQRKTAEAKAKGNYKVRVWTPERGWEDSTNNRIVEEEKQK